MCNWVKPLFSGDLCGQFKCFRGREREEGLGAVSGSRLCCSTRAGRWEAFCRSTTARLPCPLPGPPAALSFAGDTLHRDTRMSLVSAEGKICAWRAQGCAPAPFEKGLCRIQRAERVGARSPACSLSSPGKSIRFCPLVK